MKKTRILAAALCALLLLTAAVPALAEGRPGRGENPATGSARPAQNNGKNEADAPADAKALDTAGSSAKGEAPAENGSGAQRKNDGGMDKPNGKGGAGRSGRKAPGSDVADALMAALSELLEQGLIPQEVYDVVSEHLCSGSSEEAAQPEAAQPEATPSEPQSEPAAQSPSASQQSSTDEVLSRLLSSGAITQEEYDALKAR